MDSNGRNAFLLAIGIAAVTLVAGSSYLPRGMETLSPGNIAIAGLALLVLRFTVWRGAK